MRLVFGDDANVAAWVAARIPQMSDGADFGPCRGLGVVSDQGAALGGVVFHNYQPRFRNIEVSFAADTPRWLTRTLIREILSYPFAQLDCRRITTLTPRRAASARRFLDAFGFKREGCIRYGFGNDHMIVSGLLKREWLQSKWMTGGKASGNPHGQAAADATASARPHGHRRGADGLEPADGALSGPAEQRQFEQPIRDGDQHLQPDHQSVQPEHHAQSD